MILRNVPPAEEEVEDARYGFGYQDFWRSINMQLNYMDSSTHATLPLPKV